MRILIAASGTGGHLFPALAVAQHLPHCQIEWLGVPNRLEQTLVPQNYPLHQVDLEGFQTRLNLETFKILQRFGGSILQTRRILKNRQIDAIFTTGGYIAAPAILAARWQNIPVILHESNALPGKVTRFFGPWCTKVALGFESTAQYFPKNRAIWTGTPTRDSFLTPQPLDLPIPPEAPLIVVMGGSQGAVAINQLVRQAAKLWFKAGAYVVHLTGDRDPDADQLQHPQYISLPFYENVAGLLQRATLAISRAGASALTELTVTQTPAILIPYPYAAEDHQAYNANEFVRVGAGIMYRQKELSPEELQNRVLQWLNSPAKLQAMAAKAKELAVFDSAEQLAKLIQTVVTNR
ncbi:MAG: undecaprenyldiphospho-muramoylpentapeptide beta-N-acetylglucosaminyltransferase [Jaaginema sp. PMC 1079.18]|nr:undecaprenyldiphospho-muramoylpentapeptide beta-N-acetylglucosaminyltransferase [Jaaginema sp. PMC 1080.18]MEC4851890.1 undecaprenyldiphospho-muramoylpentapeptide beta-N-acetylglucosaminyltransferase [Jaaginema sp. PMC 1079.18]MEC4866474.1 undecaprenyldiphospho-muramoylpentapeptide beta-N-acetylglucosaminyltransferase [Jaaginema sp. PMC 1078.18]